jgi:hypothetical protein
VFGRTIVCRSRAIAEEVAAGGELDGITMEGDLVRRKGTISGGYSNAARSKYKLFREVRRGGKAAGWRALAGWQVSSVFREVRRGGIAAGWRALAGWQLSSVFQEVRRGGMAAGWPYRVAGVIRQWMGVP